MNKQKFEYKTIYASRFDEFDKRCTEMAEKSWVPIMAPFNVETKDGKWIAQQWVKSIQPEVPEIPDISEGDLAGKHEFFILNGDQPLEPNKKIIEDSDGNKWMCTEAPVQDPFMYEDNEVFVADEIIYLKGYKIEPKDVDVK